MKMHGKIVNLLMAEDDNDDYLLAQDALKQSRVANKIFRVRDGEELITYLEGQDQYSNRNDFPLPNLIFLDLNMPKIDGREALALMRKKDLCTEIPIVVMTTSKSEEDIVDSYKLGVNSYIRKPVSFQGLVDVMTQIGNYWFEVVELPEIKE